jgi:hypothetical protein
MLASTAMIVGLWALTHRYAGISRDAELYAFQALARLHPNLKADIYLAFTSQDNYTVFSPIYAWFIQHWGLQAAELTMFILCGALYFWAAHSYSHSQFGKTTAWLSVSALVIASSSYGAYDVFSFSDDYLTARSLAVAMIATSLALYHNRLPLPAFLTAIASMFVHPLMAFPGLVLLVFLRLPIRWSLIMAVLACIGMLLIGEIATFSSPAARRITLMDPAWLEVVQQRSQFLFLRYWRASDWELAARPFVSLTLTALVIGNASVRKLCMAAMLVGASGFLVAEISESIGPVAFFVQGQGWRWVWVTGFIAVLLLPPTAIRIWQDEKCGPFCALLLTLAWIWNYSGADYLLLINFALGLWLARELISDLAARFIRWAAAAACIILTIWMIATPLSNASTSTIDLAHDTVLVGRAREFFGSGISSALLAAALCWFIHSARSAWIVAATFAVLLASNLILVPHSFKQTNAVGTVRMHDEFADWRAAIPPTSSVLLVPMTSSSAFVWFVLDRPNYMSVDQSAGVVFSRDAATEIRRRSTALLPIAEPDWLLLTQNNRKRQGKTPDDPPARALTTAALGAVCGDPALGFVAAKEDLGFSPVRHSHAGAWDKWNLYDCRDVRDHGPTS